MAAFIKGLELCKGFFLDVAKPILDRYFPGLPYSAGLIGYGSDVLGYDDEVSSDHMWGPRFYLFVEQRDIGKKTEILRIFSENFPYCYKGYSVHFSEPDWNDNGVQRPVMIHEGKVNPLVFILTWEDFLSEQIGISDCSVISLPDWLSFSEHRLLSLVSGTMFIDQLDLMRRIAPLRYYPREVKNYLIASNWDMIASEQAFVKRCGSCGDEIGSRLVCARIAERLIRLCFLYREVYAPYSKWLGTAFHRLDIDYEIKNSIESALRAGLLSQREEQLVKAQALVADLHNQSGVTEFVDYRIESYFGRDIQVIFAEKFAQATAENLKDNVFETLPLIGTLSQIGGFSSVSNDCFYREQIKNLYGFNNEKKKP